MESIKKLYDFIESFLVGDLDGETFERMFSDSYDFEEFEEEDLKFFEKVRTLLERFSPYVNDLKEYPDYFINEKQLKAEIIYLKSKESHSQ